MTTNPIIPLPDALRKAEAVSTSGEYEQFLEGVREKNPRRFQSDSRVIERDYLRIVDHHLRNLIPLVQRYIGSNVRRVLDFGCGSGGSAIALAMVFPQIRCFGTDVDADEVDVALKRAKLYGVHERCQFVPVRENEPLPYPDASFDFCLCSSVLEYVTDKDARKFCVQEMTRLIAPGGLLFVSGPNRLYPFEVHSWWNGNPKWGWNYFPKLLHARTVDCTVWEVQRLARPDVLTLYNTPLIQLFKPWSNFCLRKKRLERILMAGNVNKEIQTFILKSFPLARKKQIKDSDSLLKSGLVDSLGVLTVVEFLEQTFSIKIEDDELLSENFETIDEMARFLQEKTHGMKAKS